MKRFMPKTVELFVSPEGGRLHYGRPCGSYPASGNFIDPRINFDPSVEPSLCAVWLEYGAASFGAATFKFYSRISNRIRQIVCFAFVLIVVFFAKTAVHSAETGSWPVFHGPKGDNKSLDTGLLKEWPKGGPRLLWTVDFIGYGYSGVSLADGRIVTSGNIEQDGKTLATVFCLDGDGKLIWKNDNGPGLADRRRYPSTRATPTIDGDRVYDESALGQVSCFDAETGRKIWSRNIIDDYGSEIPRWFLGESVVIDGDNLICCPGGPKACALALNKMTGETVWAAAPTGHPTGYSTPYFFTFDGTRVVAIETEKTVEGLDPATGKTLFSFPWQNFRTTNVTMPVYRDGHLLMTSGYGFGTKLFKLTKNGDGTITPSEVWYEKRFDNHHGGVILAGDHVYGTTHEGSWGSIHFDTGKIGYLVRSIGSGSVHYADGLIYGLSEDDKTVILLKPEPDKYVEISRFELPNAPEGKSWAHPVVCGGRLYIRHAQYLYCYDVGGK